MNCHAKRLECVQLALFVTRISVLTGRGAVSLSSFGGEGQGEEVVVLRQHAR